MGLGRFKVRILEPHTAALWFCRVASSDCLKQAEDLSFEYKYDILSEKMLNCAVEHVHAMYVRNPSK